MKRHILIVDDERQIRDLLSLYLGREGFTVSTTATAGETLQWLGEHAADLVVLDIGLQQEDGLELLAKIKASHPGLPVIMLTGMGFVEDLLEEAQTRGADSYVSKGLPLNELLLAIKTVMSVALEKTPS